MGMFGARIDLEALQDVLLETIGSDHSSHGHLDNTSGVGGTHAADGGSSQMAPVMRVVNVFLLLLFVAGEDHLFGIDDHHIVPHIQMGREDGLVLASQGHGDLFGDMAEGLPSRVHQEPLAFIGGGSLWDKSFSLHNYTYLKYKLDNTSKL